MNDFSSRDKMTREGLRNRLRRSLYNNSRSVTSVLLVWAFGLLVLLSCAAPDSWFSDAGLSSLFVRASCYVLFLTFVAAHFLAAPRLRGWWLRGASIRRGDRVVFVLPSLAGTRWIGPTGLPVGVVAEFPSKDPVPRDFQYDWAVSLDEVRSGGGRLVRIKSDHGETLTVPCAAIPMMQDLQLLGVLAPQ